MSDVNFLIKSKKMESVEGIKKGQKRSCEDCAWEDERPLKKPFSQEPNSATYLPTDIAPVSSLSTDNFPQSTNLNVIPDEKSTGLSRVGPKDESEASTSSSSCAAAFSTLTVRQSPPPSKPNDSNNNKIQSDNLTSASSLSTGTHTKVTSANNRKVYGLRPRTSMKRVRCVSPEDAKVSVFQEPEKKVSAEEEASASTHNDIQPPVATATVAGTTKSKSSSKPRSSKSKPLSRYRRITANARERDRMKEINTAFATLRAVLPTFANSRIASMTKYTTLQLAASYIKSLSDILNEAPTSENENKKENCPTFQSANISNVTGSACTNHQNVNLSVGISEIPFSKSNDTNSSQKSSDFSVFTPSLGPSNNFNEIPDDALGELGDISNLPDMCWTLDLMLE